MSSSHKLFKLDSKNYSWEELKTNYKKLAIQNHPDKGGDPDFFNYITEQFNKLAIELKNRDNNRNHFDLKSNYESSIKKNTGVNNLSADETFHSKFNKSFEENKFIDEDVEFGYGEMMVKSSKVREDINIKNLFGKTKVSNNKFNKTFENKVPTTNIIKYQEPEALTSCKNIIHSEIGVKTTDYSGTTSNNSLQYTDFKLAFTENRIPSVDTNKKQFRNIKEYQQYSDSKLKESLTEKELKYRRKQELFEKQKEDDRIKRLQERDRKMEEYYERVSRLGIGM